MQSRSAVVGPIRHFASGLVLFNRRAGWLRSWRLQTGQRARQWSHVFGDRLVDSSARELAFVRRGCLCSEPVDGPAARCSRHRLAELRARTVSRWDRCVCTIRNRHSRDDDLHPVPRQPMQQSPAHRPRVLQESPGSPADPPLSDWEGGFARVIGMVWALVGGASGLIRYTTGKQAQFVDRGLFRTSIQAR